MGFRTNGGDTLVRYDLLLKQKKPAMEPYYAVKGKVHYQWAFQLIRKVPNAIDSGIFYPTPGWQCKECPFGTACQKDQ